MDGTGNLDKIGGMSFGNAVGHVGLLLKYRVALVNRITYLKARTIGGHGAYERSIGSASAID